MAHVHITAGPGRSAWMGAIGLVAAAGLAAGASWWLRAEPDRETTAPPAVQQVSAREAQAPDTAKAPDLSGMAVEKLKALQTEAARAIEQDPGMKPIEGVVSERPAFVSHLEWMMLKGAAGQHASPDKELTRMVNFLRFTKQLEMWQALPRDAQTQARRQALASQLLDDLPQRLVHREMSVKDLQALQGQLIEDVVRDPQQRAARAALESRRLDKVASAG